MNLQFRQLPLIALASLLVGLLVFALTPLDFTYGRGASYLLGVLSFIFLIWLYLKLATPKGD